MNKSKTKDMAELALFVAMIILLSVTPLGYVSLGVINATTIQLPVIIGAILFGWKKGLFLGGVFGVTSLLKNTFQPNITSFVFSPFIPVFGTEEGSIYASIVCLVPRMLIGAVVALTYFLLSKTKLRKMLIYGICGFLGSMTNTVLVMFGIYFFFGGSYSVAQGIAYNTLLGTVSTTITTVGIIEALVSAVITAGICGALFKLVFKR